ncbi:MAG: UDP-N-acetylmuramate--L-alanine ligase [Parachlamydiaceae bacterium]
MENKTPYHFVGIGGIGMSGLARILLGRGYQVSGTDQNHSSIIQALQDNGATISIGHHEKHLPVGATLVYSSSIDSTNPEIKAAQQNKHSLMHRSELLKQLMVGQKPLLVAGTHGKTTITSLLTHLLKFAGMEPSFAIGGIAPTYSTNAAHGEGEYFVAEADESDGSFLRYDPYGAIISNIDTDHMDYYKTEKALFHAFEEFASKVKNPDLLLYCGDDIGLAKLKVQGISYGFGPNAVIRGENFRQQGFNVSLDVIYKGKAYKGFTVPLPGRHTGLNALAVIGMGLQLGIPEDKIRHAMATFGGVNRRAEVKQNSHHIIVIDDYGHHPTEIYTTLQGLKAAFPLYKLLVYFQPHRYSRTKDCLHQFGECFEDADELVITDIYAAGEAEIEGVNAKLILDEVKRASTLPVHYVSRDQLEEDALQRLTPYTVLVTLGAGDITKLGPNLDLSKLKKFKLALLFGGKSSEHEISLKSARNIFEVLDKQVYDIKPFFISKKGAWVSGEEAFSCLYEKEGNFKGSFTPILELATCSAAFPVFHGPNGEDGTVQGLLEMLLVPFAGCSSCSSAATMDKAMTKKLAMHAGLQVVPFVHFHGFEWKQEADSIVTQVEASLVYPLYVKPVHLGSTIGISRVKTREELVNAITKALQYDDQVLVEKEIKGREIEFALFGSDQLVAYPPGEIKSCGKTYGYEEKYFSDAIEAVPQADLSQKLVQSGIEFAKRAYRALSCDGYARVDCFLDPNGEYYLNEINPIPGFTNNSLFPKIVNLHGMNSKDLVTELILIGMENARKRERKRL